MAINPMQKKARNSFLLGVIITLVICILIAIIFYFLVMRPGTTGKKEDVAKVQVCVLSQDIKSGQIITSNLLQVIEVYENMVPNNYVDNILMDSMNLQDVDGNVLYTNSKGELYILLDKETNVYKTAEKNKKQVTIEIDENTGRYYKTRKEGEAEHKEYIEFLSVPIVAKINMNKNSIVTIDAIAKSDEVVTDDLREVEYNMLSLPRTIEIGDHIDVRLLLPNGQDLIVISKKEVKDIFGDTIKLELTEEEILMMESAIVESYIMKASKLYAVKYVDPGLQQAAVKTYVPTEAVRGLIQRNENIVETAKTVLFNKFNPDVRTWTETEKSLYLMESQGNIEAGLEKEIENAKAAREAYLEGLTSY